jgi:hypothetical protein
VCRPAMSFAVNGRSQLNPYCGCCGLRLRSRAVFSVCCDAEGNPVLLCERCLLHMALCAVGEQEATV